MPEVSFGRRRSPSSRGVALAMTVLLAFIPLTNLSSADPRQYAVVTVMGTGALSVLEDAERMFALAASVGPQGGRLSIARLTIDTDACSVDTISEIVDAPVRVDGESVSVDAMTASIGRVELRWEGGDPSSPALTWSRQPVRYGAHGCQIQEMVVASVAGAPRTAIVDGSIGSKPLSAVLLTAWTFADGVGTATLSEEPLVTLPGG